MAGGPMTAANIGVRRLITSLPGGPEYRNFEPFQWASYRVVASYAPPYTYTYYGLNGAVQVAPGEVIPHDDPTVGYTNMAQLERDWNAGLIDPAF